MIPEEIIGQESSGVLKTPQRDEMDGDSKPGDTVAALHSLVIGTHKCIGRDKREQ
jgi:hypothetical protein